MSRASGFKGARKRAKSRPNTLDRLTVAGIEETVGKVHSTGRSNIDAMVKRRSGRLRRRYARTVRKQQKTGLVGYISRSARRDAFYARFVHDGTRYLPARPFHDLAVSVHDAGHKKRMRKALSVVAGPSRLVRSGRGPVREA